MDQVTLVQVLSTAQPGSPHATTIENEREAPLNNLSAQLERDVGNTGQQAGAVVDDSAAGSIVAVPAREAVALRLGNPGLPRPVVELLQHPARVVTPIGPHFRRGPRGWRRLAPRGGGGPPPP